MNSKEPKTENNTNLLMTNKDFFELLNKATSQYEKYIELSSYNIE